MHVIHICIEVYLEYFTMFVLMGICIQYNGSIYRQGLTIVYGFHFNSYLTLFLFSFKDPNI